MTFKLIEEKDIPYISSVGRLYEHEETGAQVFYIKNDDQNRAFTIGFKTPPDNDNGLPHILEHSVLNGSRKYPSKEPFVELIKGSLNTFVNAMTYSDKTIYPVASTNQQDFTNLMAVYLDAVFQPNLYDNEQILQQEGWHYHLEKFEDPLIYKGVVYNEMKGATASPESHLYLETAKGLYPGTLYAYESGGLPSAIPSLTQKEFIAFHQKHYHPSQSLTVLYGAIDEEVAFAQLAEYFDGAGQVHQKVDLAIDVPYVSNAMVETVYSITDGDDPENKDYLSLAWHTHVAEDLIEGLGLAIVKDVLFGNNQAPLKKVLLASELANDYAAYHDQIGYFSSFNIIAKNTQLDQAEAFVRIVDDKLAQIAKEGVDDRLIEAALNQFVFRNKEMVISESNPRGVMYAINAYSTWLYNGGPFDSFNFEEHIAILREKFKNGYFQELVQLYLVDNDHRVLVKLKADPGLNDRQEKETFDKLQDYKNRLSQAQITELVASTQALLERQNTPDSVEDLVKIPMLSKEDLTTETEDYPFQVTPLTENTRLYYAEQFTAGIDYLELLFSMDDFSTEDYQWLSLVTRLLGKLDTQNYSSQELLTAMDIYTGGISSAIQLFEQKEDVTSYFSIKGKALEEMSDHLIALMKEIALYTKFDNLTEIRKIIQSSINRFEEQIHYSSHSLAANRALSQLSLNGYLTEQVAGIDHYFFLKEVLELMKSEQAQEVISKIEAVYHKLANKARLNLFYIGDSERKVLLSSQVAAAFSELSTATLEAKYPHQVAKKQKEAFITSQDVNYVALTGKISEFEMHGKYAVLGNALRYDYLWNNIRVKGGAYGAIYHLKRTGLMTMVSYRDPNIAKTIETYQGVPQFIENLAITEADLLKYIIGTFSDMNQPLSAADKGNAAFVLYQLGVTYEDRKRIKEEVLATSGQELKNLAMDYQAVIEDATLVMIGNKAQIEESSELFDSIQELY